eukprot:8477825-Alexandrium_andersonii.AAC.1
MSRPGLSGPEIARWCRSCSPARQHSAPPQRAAWGCAAFAPFTQLARRRGAPPRGAARGQRASA